MLYKALISFSGKVSMAMDEVRDISDQSIAKDLLKAGYIEEVKSEKKVKPNPRIEEKVEPKPEPEKKAETKTKRKKKASSKK